MGRGPNATISFVYCMALAALNSGGEVSGPSSDFTATGAAESDTGLGGEPETESAPLAAVPSRVHAALPIKNSRQQKKKTTSCRNHLMPDGPCGRCAAEDAQTTR